MSHGASLGPSHRGLQVGLALIALLTVAVTWVSVGGGASPVSTALPALSTSASAPSTTTHRAARAQGKLPLAFVPNRGQTRKSVRYYSPGAGHAFYFTRKRAVLSFSKGKQGVALYLTPLGASPDTRLVAGERAPGKINYLVGAEHHRNLPSYREVAYRDVWPGVDLVFRGRGGALKYELHARAGADLSRIALAYGGADGIAVGKGGGLLIGTPLGTLRDAPPRSYQRIGGKRVPVGSRYAVKSGNAYGFALGGSYDSRHPLVIDPGIEYSTFLGGAGADRADGVAVDSAGNAYVTGRANAGFPTTAGAFDTSSNGPSGSGDAFVTKLNAAGSALEYSTFIGGATAGDSGLAIAIDGAGSAYITGSTGSSDFPTTTGAFDTTYNAASGAANAFVTKLSPDGSALAYSTYLGGFNSSGFFDLGSGIAVDSTGAAYVAGDADSTNFPTTAGAFDTTQNGSVDAFVTKLNPAGSALVYSTLVGGTSFDSSTALAVDGAGNAYLAGYGTSSDYPTTPGAFDTSYNSGWDVFVTKLNASGSALSYSTYLGGAAYDEARGITVDGAGSTYVTGHTFSAAYPTTAGAYDTSYDNSVGGSDAFVTKLNDSGSALSYSTFLGGSGDDLGEGIAVDGSGRAYVTGYTEATNFPTAFATDATYNGGAFDAFVAKLRTAGDSLDFSTYLGGSSDDRGYAVAADGATGKVYVAGQTNSSGFPTTSGAADASFNGSFDAFVTKLVPPGSTLTRREEPAVIQQSLPSSTGSATGSINVAMPDRLLGIAPGDLVAFRWDEGWEQIPVQVDERQVIDLNKPYTTTRPSCSDPCYNNPPNGGALHPEFTDSDTFVGADSDPTLDANDEVALMAFDAGGPRTTSSAPPGVDPASAVEVEITDPLDGGMAYAYLFEDTSGLDPGAGKDYVDYEFNLTNGPYKTGAYNPTGTAPGAGMNRGPRPETSFVETDNYRRGFTDRWYDNELRITRGGATGVDILDRHDDQFDSVDASCVRTQATFRAGEGAFVANTDGPVRAIRDFVGANSGPHVQRQHIFYGGLEVINTYLRVHPIPGVHDFFDYSEAGIGLTYENGVMTPGGVVSGTPPGGVPIDGQPDAVTGAGSAQADGYESVDGPQGALSMPQRLLTNNPDPSYHLNYRDGNVPNQTPCTGDDDELYGASGPQLNSAINNTDEAGRNMWGGGQFSNLFYQRSIYYEAPGQANGPQRLAEMQQPLGLTLRGIDLGEPPASAGYPRPKGATPAHVSLVPAYQQCTSPDRTHGPPLDSPSCNPPAQESGHLTIGTPDANGRVANAIGSARFAVRPGNPATSDDEADVALTFTLTDVRDMADLGDYTGELEASAAVRITDRDNGSGPGTVEDFSYAFTVPCGATSDGTVGSTCATTTTADALVPGAIKEGMRSIWQIGQVEVFDGGADGLASTRAGNTPFARQGIFVP